MLSRARKVGGRWGIFSGPRFGFYDRANEGAAPRENIWIHAVSLGETRAVQPLIQALLAVGERILLTHTTVTGRDEGQRLFAEAVANGSLVQEWLPYDFPGATRRFFHHFQPRLGLLVEREVWPNLLYQAARKNVPMVLVSARFSASALRQARWLGGALRQAYGRLHVVLAQTQEDASRLREIGAGHVQVVGNMKFDLALPAAQVQAGRVWRSQLNRPVVAIASTREGEDAVFVELIARTTGAATGNPLYLLIPRHPQRFSEVAAILDKHGIAYSRRASDHAIAITPDTRVLLGDTLGEMPFYYAVADVAIIGGGFAPLGGQNLIEACAAGTPVIVGPHMHNFEQATRDAVAAGAALQVADAADAMREAAALLNDGSRRAAMSEAALVWTASHAGATNRIMQALRPWLRR
nr:3-deoxy-D-manno-octulosonic acid transferase [Bordetella sp. LUAb4]